MREDEPGLADLQWASSEDRIRAEVDQSLYGECWVRADAAGLFHRLDPLAINFEPERVMSGLTRDFEQSVWDRIWGPR